MARAGSRTRIAELAGTLGLTEGGAEQWGKEVGGMAAASCGSGVGVEGRED